MVAMVNEPSLEDASGVLRDQVAVRAEFQKRKPADNAIGG